MKKFLRENIVLIAGVTLPLLLTVIFFIATQFDKASNEYPLHSVIYTDQPNYNANRSSYQFVVKKDQLHFVYTASDTGQNWKKPRLYVFNPQANTSQEIELPIINESDTKIDIPLPYFASKTISTLLTSPDGYTFKSNYRHNVNILTSLFGGGSKSRNRVILSKGSSNIIIPDAARYNTHFIGWIVGEQGVANGK
ncbi:hypothetical protein AB835_07760 [Candidatus Endobugula sertula]|uniref:Uncharacterized protein n=1 Tax=Candidatus Endobugula sertula TaxID=62101 RepID=A0A1D2QQ35_9GAMM|nr:hypothetical protein AB835_07760 [Candidatus Endobugula sertula]